MKRREFIALVGGAAASPCVARAQQRAGRTASIGFVGVIDNPIIAPGYPAFLDELKKSGFSEGQNLVIGAIKDIRDTKRFFFETADLARSNVDVLVAVGREMALQAAVEASRAIPIVVWAINYDPIARGFVKSLTHPGAATSPASFLCKRNWRPSRSSF
jgi:putative ABC transport system substrate-binding protein